MKLAKKQNKNLDKLFEVIDILANGGTLEAKYTMILQATIRARVSVTLNQTGYDEIADEIFKLREQREKCTVDTAARDAQIARINELQDFIKQQPAHLEAFDEALVKRWLERIIVWEDHFTVEFKSGLNIDIEG